jgi:transcriptional regulator with XRE-family HTH domain
VASRIRYVEVVAPLRPYLGDLVDDDDLYAGPARQMPTLASALVVQARQRAGLTQLEVAERAGTSRSAISAIEHGRRDPSLESLQKIVLAAGFDLLTRLVPHDDHDDVLKAAGERMDPETRRARNTAMRELADEVREAMKQSRPLHPR